LSYRGILSFDFRNSRPTI